MSSRGWQGRPKWAAVVQVLIVAVPVIAGVVASVVFSHAVNRPRSVLLAVPWWLATFAISTGVMYLCTKLSRRALPLATLLKLSMAFPDKTPSRLSMALRAGTIGNLKARLSALREEGIESEAGPAAETILVLAAAMNAHDRNTRGHAERVRALTEMLGEEMGLSIEDREKLRWSALLHDVGKVMVDPAILNKHGALDDDEWAVIHRHPDEGARIAAPLRGWLGEWAMAIEQHHEKFDGTGYPRHLAGMDISRAARIVAVADAFEVMTSARSYKEAMSARAAREELAAGAGTHFDPNVVRAFLNLSMGRVRWILGPLTWFAQTPFLRAAANAGSNAGAAVGGAAAVATGAAVGLMPVAAPTTVPEPPPIVVAAPAAAPAASAPAPAPGAPATAAAGPPGQPAPAPTTLATAPIATAATVAPTTAAPTTTRPNRPPVAVDDQWDVATQSRRIAVLQNDSDPDDPALTTGTIRVVEQPKYGKANASSSGEVNYVPEGTSPDGTDSFVYELCDPVGACSRATVTLKL